MGSLHAEESYVRLQGRRRRRPAARGFRLCPRNRCSVRRLRAKLLTFLGLVGKYVRLLVRRLSHSHSAGGGGNGCGRSGSRRVLVAGAKDAAAAAANKQAPRRAAAAAFMRSNSFYAQAIADCLEFIKHNSVPVEDYGSASARRSQALETPFVI